MATKQTPSASSPEEKLSDPPVEDDLNASLNHFQAAFFNSLARTPPTSLMWIKEPDTGRFRSVCLLLGDIWVGYIPRCIPDPETISRRVQNLHRWFQDSFSL